MNKLLILPTLLLSLHGIAQKDTVNVDAMSPIEEVFSGETDKEPEFPGGSQEMMKWISESVNYPAQAVKDSIAGKVYVQFIVEKDGTLSEIEIIRSPHVLLSDEVTRLVKAMPNWSPGKFEGETVRVRYILPINFSL